MPPEAEPRAWDFLTLIIVSSTLLVDAADWLVRSLSEPLE